MLHLKIAIPALFASMVIGLFGEPAPALSASAPQRLVYQVHHSRYGAIGTYTNAVEKSGNETKVNTEAHIQVSILGVVLYRQEVSRQEQWNGDRLMSFHGVTTVNGRPVEMTGAAQGDRFVVMSPDGDIVAPATVRIANPWSSDVLHGNTIMTPDRGRIENVQVKGGEETSLAVNGQNMRAKRYEIDRLDGTKRYEVWLDDRGTPVQFSLYNNGGTVTFTLTG